MLPPPPDAAAAAAMAATEAEEELALFLLKTDFLYERGLSPPPPPLDFSFSSTMLHEPRGDASPPPGLRGLNGVEECVRYGLEQLPDIADIKVEMMRGDEKTTLIQIYSHGVHLDDLLG